MSFIYITPVLNLLLFYNSFSLKIEINKTIDNINANKKLNNAIKDILKMTRGPKFIVKAATISKAVISML